MLIKSALEVMHESKVVIKNISYSYPTDANATLANVSTKIQGESVVAIVGSNGSGKSTFLKSVFGLLKVQQGTIKICGIDSQNEFRKLIKICSFVNQRPTIDFQMTGIEILSYFSSMYGIPKRIREKRIEELVETLGLQDLIYRKTSSYSGGNLQKIHLAIGLVNNPSVLLLDEPTNNLDAMSKHEVWSYLQNRSRKQKKTSIIISHDLEYVEKYADSLIVMDNGRILYQGTLDDFVASMNRDKKTQAKLDLTNQSVEELSSRDCKAIKENNLNPLDISYLRDKKSQRPEASTHLFDALCHFTNFGDQYRPISAANRRGDNRGQKRNRERNR